MKITRKVRIAAAVAASALALTGINASAAQAAPNKSGSGIHVVVMGGAPSDPFWSTVKNGTLDAALAVQNAGGKVTVVSMPDYKNFNADAAKLVAKMKTLKPSAVVIPNWVPASQNANIKAISAAGIPVIIYNSGQDSVKDVNGKIYIGSDEYVAGKTGGKYIASKGAKNVLCVNTLPGLANTEARCKGVKDGASGTKVTNLNLPTSEFGNASAVTQAIKGALTKDDSIDGIVTIGQADSDSAAAAIKQAGLGSKVALGTFDVASNGLARIQAGTQLFSIDQQPYAQGYYATSYAFQLAAYAIELPVDELLSGPSLVTKANVAKVLKAAKNGRR